MTLPEVLVAAVILTGSSGAALQTWSLAARSALDGQQQQGELELLNTHLLAGRRWLVQEYAGTCRFDAASMADQLALAQPLPEPFKRSLEPDLPTGGVWLRLQHLPTDLSRRQLLTPAGSGTCALHAQELEP